MPKPIRPPKPQPTGIINGSPKLPYYLSLGTTIETKYVKFVGSGFSAKIGQVGIINSVLPIGII